MSDVARKTVRYSVRRRRRPLFDLPVRAEGETDKSFELRQKLYAEHEHIEFDAKKVSRDTAIDWEVRAGELWAEQRRKKPEGDEPVPRSHLTAWRDLAKEVIRVAETRVYGIELEQEDGTVLLSDELKEAAALIDLLDATGFLIAVSDKVRVSQVPTPEEKKLSASRSATAEGLS